MTYIVSGGALNSTHSLTHIRLINGQPQAIHNMKHIKHIQWPWQWQYKKTNVISLKNVGRRTGMDSERY